MWAPHPTEGFTGPHYIVHREGNTVFLKSGEKLPANSVRPYFEEDSTCDDNTALTHLDDANIVQNLYKRYGADEIYTYTCNVLLAVNPYKSMSHLYSSELKNKYNRRNNQNKGGILPPHPYAIADLCYRNLVHEKKSQSLIISGESGMSYYLGGQKMFEHFCICIAVCQ